MSSMVIVNPAVPESYLPPALANGYKAQSHVFFLVFGAWFWDFVNAIPEEYTTVWRRRQNVVTMFYISSRLATFCAIVTAILVQITPTTHCNILKYFMCLSMAVASAGGSFLFVVRLFAVYDRSRVIAAITGILWTSTLGTSIAVPFSLIFGHIGPTDFCIAERVGWFGSLVVPFSITTVFDTLVFVLITWRMGMVSQDLAAETSYVSRLLSLLRGDGLPRFSKAVLQHGQKYFLATVVLNILVVVMLTTPTVPNVLHSIFIIPTIAMQNALSCRIYRETMLDIASVRSQRIDIVNQSPLQFQRDIDLSDMMSKNGLGSLDRADSL
ncbi:hypothetical protein EUX98_g6639 [Antrodiella citrinella]|uniref:G-protein coupled receptors family 1 profile domain-containing protein n=1 Tax=Antrodiella citrinella TaxID=2447956 RepID=A0A4S4MNS6_9APHY|nr:hypothetical protein EUX98_g6639 [Antrodiella citrinella]